MPGDFRGLWACHRETVHGEKGIPFVTLKICLILSEKVYLVLMCFVTHFLTEKYPLRS